QEYTFNAACRGGQTYMTFICNPGACALTAAAALSDKTTAMSLRRCESRKERDRIMATSRVLAMMPRFALACNDRETKAGRESCGKPAFATFPHELLRKWIVDSRRRQ